jgi:hypothetical protein
MYTVTVYMYVYWGGTTTLGVCRAYSEVVGLCNVGKKFCQLGKCEVGPVGLLAAVANQFKTFTGTGSLYYPSRLAAKCHVAR